MSKKRHTVQGTAEPAGIVPFARDYPAAHAIAVHRHDKDQLVYASQGVMTVQTGMGTWVIPTHRAVWIPAGVDHSITMAGKVAMRTLYFRPGLVRRLPQACCVVNVPPLLRELILHACRLPAMDGHVHLSGLILDRLEAIQALPLQLPALSDPRAWRVAERLIADVDAGPSIDEICRRSGASRRTVERLFLDETGMTLGRWRQQFRLMKAMRLLGAGAKIAPTAFEAGYRTPSAFIAAFRKAFGTTPARYFRTDGPPADNGSPA
jgi:AraC-like DNA-binding protein